MVVKNVEKQETGKVKFIVEVSSDEFEVAVNKAYLKNKNSINVPGFRRGKAPRMVIEGMFGKDVFYEDAVNDIAPAAFDMGATQEDIKTVGRPSLLDVDIADDKTATLTFESAVYPEVTLGQYKGLEAEKESAEVSDEDINAELERVRLRNARLETVERPAKIGDETTIDFKGFVDGVAFDGGEGHDHKLVLGSGQFIPGFEEQLVGMSAGDERDINVTFPTEYHEELAGKAAVFNVKVKEVKESQTDELDDEFAKDVSEFDTLEEYKADIRKNIAETRERDIEQAFQDQLLTMAADNMTVEIPEAMVDEKVDYMVRDFSQNLQMQGLSMEQYLGYMGTDPQSFIDSARPSALKQVRVDLLLSQIAKEENFEVSDEDIEAEYVKISEQYGIELERVKESMGPELVAEDIKTRKASELILSTGVAKAPEAKKPAKKKAAAKTEDAAEKTKEPAEKKPAKKPAAKKTASTTKKAETKDEGENKPAAKKTAKKAEPKAE